MPLQELNLIVTVKKSKEVLFQIAHVPKEKLLKINGLQIGKILPESPLMKCRACDDQVNVNLFWTKSMVVIGGTPQNQGPSKPKKEKAKAPLKRESVKKEIKKEIVEEKQEIKDVKLEKIEDGFEEVTFGDECVQKSESESEYEIPKWCEPKMTPPVKTKRPRPKEDLVLCHVCSKSIRRDMLHDHLYKHEISNDRPYECNECGKVFSRIHSLQDHLIQKHFHSIANWRCPHCPSVFNRKSLMKKHLYDKHRIGQSQSQTCPHCSLVLSNKGTLKSHIRNMHTDPSHKKQWTCQECGKIFFKKSHYDSHVKTHLPEDQKPFRCWCGKAFIHLYRFKIHQMEHEDPEKVLIKCKVCNKGFKYANSLTVHMRIHTGETPYECKFCKKRFGDRSNHRSHMKQHENEMGVKLTLSFEERRLLHHKVLNAEQLFGGESTRD